MKTYFKNIFLVSIFFYSVGHAQPMEEWVSTFDANGFSDEATHSAVDMLGSVYVTGLSTGVGTQYDFCTVKYNSAGALQWASRYNGSSNDFDGPAAIALDENGNVFVTGTARNSFSSWDIITIKYNSNGVQQWADITTSLSDQNDGGYAIEVDKSGNIFVAGTLADVPDIGPPDLDYVLIKFDTFGNKLWERRYNGIDDHNDEAFSLCLDSKDNIIITGHSYSGPSRMYDIVTVKYDQNGNLLWTAEYNGTSSRDDIGLKVKVDALDNVIVSGNSEGIDTDDDIEIIKYNSDGDVLWEHRFNSPGNTTDRVSDMEIDLQNNIYIGGNVNFTFIDQSFAVIKLNPLGTELWTRYYNSDTTRNDVLSAIALDNSDNVYVSGYSFKEDLDVDFVTLKYDLNGNQNWSRLYHGKNIVGDFARDIQIDHNSNVYVTGTFNSMQTLSDFLTIKYSQQSNSSFNSSLNPFEYSLSQNFPNPFNPSTVIRFDITPLYPPFAKGGNGGFVQLKIYDALGKEVSTLVNEKLSAGSYEVEFNGNNFPSGTYFYKLVAGEFSEVKRMILLK